MPRVGITYEEVELTAEQLLQDKVNPTIDKVRQRLGTGSLSTISKHLNTWKQQRLQASTEILPPLKTPPDPVNQAVARVWQQLQEENEAKIKEIEAAAQKRIDAAEADKTLAHEERDRLLADNQDLRALLKESRQYNAELEKKQIDMNQAYAAMEAKLQTMTEAYQTFKQMAETKLEKLQQSHYETIRQYQQEITKIEQNKNALITNIKDNAEEQRHRFITEIDSLKVERQNIQNELNLKLQELAIINEQKNNLEQNFKEQTTIANLIEQGQEKQKPIYQQLITILTEQNLEIQNNAQMQDQLIKLQKMIINKIECLDRVWRVGQVSEA